MNFLKRNGLRIAAMIVLGICCSINGMAQRNMASLEGTVSDSTGGVLQHATVQLINRDTSRVNQTTTDKGGRFILLQLTPGRYDLHVESATFKQYTQRNIVLNVDDRPNLEIKLDVGSASETVTVDADNAVIDSTNANVESLVDTVNVNELPLNGRQFLDLALILPGVSPAAGGQTVGPSGGPLNTGVQGGGNRATNNTYLIDGVDSFGFRFKNTSLRPSIAAIQQFKVLESPYDAQYGVVSGLNVNVITKAGTNAIHGELFEFLRNDALNAWNYFDDTTLYTRKPMYHSSQFGATIGLPIRKDKTFFFTSYEGLRRKQGFSTYSIVPTVLERAGDFSQSKTSTGAAMTVVDPNTGAAFAYDKIPDDLISPIAKKLLVYAPTPNLVNNPNGNNYLNTAPGIVNSYQVMGRVDQTVSSRLQLFTRYNFSDVTSYSPGLYSTFGVYNYMTVANGVFGATYVLSPNTILDLRLGYNREDAVNKSQQIGHQTVASLGIAGLDLSSDPTVDGVPRITITGMSGWGDSTNSPESRVENSEQITPSLLHTSGKHTIRLGATIWPVQLNAVSVSGTQRGSFGFTSTFSTIPMGDFLLGYVNSASLSVGRGHEDARTIMSSYYLGDDFRATRRLTLITGLRYELTPAFVDKGNRLSTFIPEGQGRIAIAGDPDNGFTGRQNRALYASPLNHVFPRFGFAYDLDGKGRMLLRGGYGVFGNIPIFNSQFLSSLNAPFAVTRSYLANKASGVELPFSAPFSNNPVAGGLPGGDEITPGFKQGYMQQWSLGVQRALGTSTGLDIEYVGNKGTHLDGVILVNQGAVNGALNVAYYRPFQNWGQFTAADSFAYSNYHSLRGKLQRRFVGGLTFISAYTYAHSLDDSPGEGNGSGNEFVVTDYYHPENDYGNSDFDVRHRFVQSGVWNIPVGNGRRFLKHKTGLVRVLAAPISDWRVSGIWQWQTGFPFTVLSGANVSGTGASDARANILCPTTEAQQGRQETRWFNTSCFQSAKTGTFGNAGRNIIRYAHENNLDMSFVRSFPIKDRKTVEFRSDIFNVPNHTQFSLTGGMGATVGALTFGKYAAAAPARIEQFALRILF